MKHETSVLGIDIAKQVFHAVGMDERGKIVCRKRLARHDLMPVLAKLPRCSSAWKPVAARMTGRDATAHMATRGSSGPRNAAHDLSPLIHPHRVEYLFCDVDPE